jgi:hypothetical protein
LKDEFKKRILIIQKDSKHKITMERKRIKIVIENKISILLKGEIEKKNSFNKTTKKIKRMKIKIDIQNKFYI